MKYKYIIIILIVSILLSEETDSSFSKGRDMSISYGLLSEKIPFTFFDISIIKNINKHSEYYGTFNYMVFGGGLGLGYKYYAKGKTESSMFISTCSHLSVLGDEADAMYGISISMGYSIFKKNKSNSIITYREKFGGEIKHIEYKKTSMNIGFSLTHMGDNSGGIIPFINLEKRF